MSENPKEIPHFERLSVATVLFVALILMVLGCSKSSVVGVYQYKWKNNYGENSMTYDLRQDGPCLLSPYVLTYAGIMTQGDVDRNAVKVNDRQLNGTWERKGDMISIVAVDGEHTDFRLEGHDLISATSGWRYVKIH